MMARMLSQIPLPLLPDGAAEIAPGVGLLAGDDGGLVIVHGLATFAWDGGDEDADVPVLPDPVPRDGERALARWGLLGEGAIPVFTPGRGIRWPGCCWRCPRWRAPGCWPQPARSTGGCGTGSTGWPRRC